MLASLGLAFLLTFLATPAVARLNYQRGIVGLDLHKEGRVLVAEMGGLSIFYSLLVVLVYHYLLGYHELLGVVFGVYMIGTLGIVDWWRRLSPLQKITSFSAVGVFVGFATGLRAPLVLLGYGLLFMAAVNFTNMLAGFNGLEIGVGAIAALGLAGASYLKGAGASLVLSTALAGALLGFLYYNRYPATVFPGDVGTLVIGATLLPAIALGRLYIPGILVFTPYALDALLKLFTAGVMTRESQSPTSVRDGKLYMPEGSNLSLPRLFLSRRPMSERDVVLSVWAVEAFFSALAIASEVMV